MAKFIEVEISDNKKVIVNIDFITTIQEVDNKVRIYLGHAAETGRHILTINQTYEKFTQWFNEQIK